MSDLSKQEQLILANYQECLSMLRHDDGRKAHLFTTFLTIQGVLFGFYSLLIQESKPGGGWIAGVAAVVSALWFLVMERMKGFIELRRVQGEELEKQLDKITGIKYGISTIRNEQFLRNDNKVLYGRHKLRNHQRWFSISKLLESLLPIITGIIWLVLLTIFGNF
jgi:hypothetical protein